MIPTGKSALAVQPGTSWCAHGAYCGTNPLAASALGVSLVVSLAVCPQQGRVPVRMIPTGKSALLRSQEHPGLHMKRTAVLTRWLRVP